MDLLAVVAVAACFQNPTLTVTLALNPHCPPPPRTQLAMREDFLQDKRLEREQLKSKATLDNLLPSHVSAALMDPEKKGQVFVQFEAEVSILFCDVMGFSDLVATVRSCLVLVFGVFLCMCVCVWLDSCYFFFLFFFFGGGEIMSHVPLDPCSSGLLHACRSIRLPFSIDTSPYAPPAHPLNCSTPRPSWCVCWTPSTPCSTCCA
jgi:hypothetical protein